MRKEDDFMRDYSEFLTEREIFVLQNHPNRTYLDIGEELGISRERVRQIKAYAERKVRAERARDDNHARALEPVQLTLRRKDVQMLLWALKELRWPIMTYSADQRRKNRGEAKPELDAVNALYEQLSDVLKTN
jgi:hypothetical protein